VTSTISDIATFKQQALQWAAGFEVTCYLDSNNFNDPYGEYDLLIAAGVKHQLKADVGTAFAELDEFRKEHTDWMMGFFTYDLKNEIEDLHSENPDGLQFPDLYFFVPEHLILVKGDQATVQSYQEKNILDEILVQVISIPAVKPGLNLQSRFSRDEYIDTVIKIKEHITRGDIYVSNFCQEFYAEAAAINPLEIFNQLNTLSPNPFSCYFKYHQQHIICASPERFLAKRGSKLISQPIKGTAGAILMPCRTN
jgi:para-aminobenzoate synthetase component 1